MEVLASPHSQWFYLCAWNGRKYTQSTNTPFWPPNVQYKWNTNCLLSRKLNWLKQKHICSIGDQIDDWKPCMKYFSAEQPCIPSLDHAPVPNPKFPIMQLDRLFYNVKQVLLISNKVAREPLKDTSFTPTKAIVVYFHGVFQDKISTAR